MTFIVTLLPPFPFAVVDECKSRLLSAGFTELRERDSWSIAPLGKVQSGRHVSIPV